MQKDTKIFLGVAGALTAGLVAFGIWRKRHVLADYGTLLMEGHYFTMSELLYSRTAVDQHLANTPTPQATQCLNALIKQLDKIRERAGIPIRVTSGYRNLAVNAAVGSHTNTSAHVFGCAADLVPASGVKSDLFKIFKAAYEVGGYDQLLLEYKSSNPSNRWVHYGMQRPGYSCRGDWMVLNQSTNTGSHKREPIENYAKYVG